MKISHVGIWVKDLENTKLFYENYFNAKSSDIYINEKKKFKSYFLEFDDFCKIEIMTKDDVLKSEKGLVFGYAHVALSLGSKENVNNLTEKLRNDGYNIVSEPRTTGDGFYESVVADPEGNLIELTV